MTTTDVQCWPDPELGPWLNDGSGWGRWQQSRWQTVAEVKEIDDMQNIPKSHRHYPSSKR